MLAILSVDLHFHFQCPVFVDALLFSVTKKMPVFKRSDFHHVKAANLIADFIVLTALFVIVNLIRLCQSNKTLSTMKIM